MKSFRQMLMLMLMLASTAIAYAQPSEDTLPATEIELRGVLIIDQNFSFSIRRDNHSEWATINQTIFGYKLIRFSPEDSVLTILGSDGKESTIQLVKDQGLVLDVISDKVTPRSETTEQVELIDPETLKQVHLVSARDKIHYKIVPRSSIQPSIISTNHARSTRVFNESPDTEGVSSKETDSTGGKTTNTQLTELEEIALSIYEKHHVPTREAPTDVDVFFTVTPR